MKIPGSGRILENGVSCLPSTSTPTPQAEKQVIAELTARAESNLREGNLYYVVSMRWYTCWQNYVGQDAKSCSSIGQFVGVPEMLCRPGPIDNSELVLNVNGSDDDDDPEIIRTLEEERDYVLVPAEAWNKLFEWYNGGPPLPRKLICQGAAYKQFNVEVYPLRLQLTDARDNSQTIIRLSKKATLHEFYEKVCMCKGLELDKVRIWDYFNKSKGLELCPSDQTLEESNLLMDQDVLLDLEDCACSATASGGDSIGKELILVPMEPSRSSMTIAGGPAFSNGHSTHYVSNLCSGSALTSARASKDDGYDRFGIAGTDERTGLAGLQNLGNTCFMNSALQCLVHTPSLVHYFLQDYSDEINKNNPLGMGGELAVAFGDLLRSMWSTGRTTVAPRQFKGKVARFAPQFSGYNQHDSQEFLAFLLDGLHEDLNRVKQKPYIEMKDSDGRPDAEYADECWKNHKTRNDSIIVDICQGQYKSTLVCPVCYKISITFDPFMYLTLPLPSTVNRTMTVTVFYGDGSGLPMPYTVLVPKHGCIRDLYHALSTACCLRNVEILLLAEVYNHKIYRYLEVPLEPLSSIKDDDHIVAYRVPEKEPGLKRIEILHQHTEMSDNLKVHDEKLLGTPLVTYIGEEDPTTTIIDSAICRVLSPLRKSTFVGSSKAHEDGCDLEEIGNQAMATCSYENEGGCRLMEDAEGGRMFSFKLLVDQRGSTKMQIEEDYAMKTGQVVRVMLNWTNNLLKSYDISFLEDLPVVCKSGFTVKKTRQETISLFSCLEAFLKEEPLGPDDMWYCPQCKEHRQATKKLDLWRLPEILVIHLKRFSYNRYLKNKLDSFVNFPIHNLDLSKYIRTMASCRASHVYELYAISNHYGGLGGGHYTAYAKLVNDSTWYHFDDSHVSPVGEGDIVTSAGYVLFYRRVYVRDEIQAGKSANGSCSVREA